MGSVWTAQKGSTAKKEGKGSANRGASLLGREKQKTACIAEKIMCHPQARSALDAQMISILIFRGLFVVIALLANSSTRFRKNASSAIEVRFAPKERRRNARQDKNLWMKARLSVINARVDLMASMEFATNAKQALIKERMVNKAARSARHLECTLTKARVSANSAHMGTSVRTQLKRSNASMDFTHWAALQNAQSAHLATNASLGEVQLSCAQQANTAVLATAHTALADIAIL